MMKCIIKPGQIIGKENLSEQSNIALYFFTLESHALAHMHAQKHCVYIM